jgi:hypothetical protein
MSTISGTAGSFDFPTPVALKYEPQTVMYSLNFKNYCLNIKGADDISLSDGTTCRKDKGYYVPDNIRVNDEPVKGEFNINGDDVCVSLFNDGGNLSATSVRGKCGAYVAPAVQEAALEDGQVVAPEDGSLPMLDAGSPMVDGEFPMVDREFPMLDEGSPMVGDPLREESPEPPMAENTVPEIFAGNGVSCAAYGRPSSDNRIREYTQEECDILGGRFASASDYSNQCLIPGGGSYSWDCRALNENLQPFTNISKSKKSRRTESFYGGDDLKCKARY